MARNFQSSVFFWIRIGGAISGRNNSSILSRDLTISLSLDCLLRLGSLSLSFSFSQCSPKAWYNCVCFFIHFNSSHFISSCPMTNHDNIIHNQNVHNQGPKMLCLGSKNMCLGSNNIYVWATTICVWAATIFMSGQQQYVSGQQQYLCLGNNNMCLGSNNMCLH